MLNVHFLLLLLVAVACCCSLLVFFSCLLTLLLLVAVACWMLSSCLFINFVVACSCSLLNILINFVVACCCSLLDILAGRKDFSGLNGTVLVNGERQPKNFKCIAGYVVQVGGLCCMDLWPQYCGPLKLWPPRL